jgi:TonB family protein
LKLSAQKIVLMICLFAVNLPAPVQAQQGGTLSDRDVKVDSFQELIYPPLARNAHIQGTVVVRVKLDHQGRVAEAVAISGPELLILDCITNVKKWRFEPNASETAVIVYNFTILEGRCNSDSSLFILQGANLATIITCPPKINTSSR